MAKIVGKKVKWVASTAADVVAHKVYVCPEGTTMDYNTPAAQVNMPTLEYVLPGVFNMSVEQNYQVGISAVDDVGNESDIVKVTIPFDLVAPTAPSGVQVVNQ